LSDDIIVYDKMTTDFANYGLAVLENAYNPRVYRRLNSDYIADFHLPLTDDKREHLEQENIVKIGGQLFIIRGVTDSLDDRGVLSVFVECEHVFYELYSHFLPTVSQSDASSNVILAAVLDGTRFTGDATALSGTHDFTVDKENAIWGINHLIALTDAEMERDNFTITFKSAIGADNGVSFREGKNIRSISRKVDSSGVITKLYVYGKDDVTIDPIESQYIDDYPTTKSGKVVFPDVSDTGTLATKGAAYLAIVEVPKYTYQVKVVELKQALGWDSDEAFALGDTVHIYVESLDIEVTARVVEYEEFPKNPEESNVTFSNFVPGIEDTLTLLNDTRATVDGFTSGRKLNTFFLDGEINTLRNFLKASGAYDNATVLDDGGFLLENTKETSSDFGALYIGPGILAIAESKDESGNWQWTTFGTGKGFTADLMNAGTIRAALVKILGDTNFYWDDTNIYIIDPSDDQKQIRIGKYDGTNYGIGFTTDGGSSWKQSLDFGGLVIGGDTTFDDGYDPTTKETPTGAQSKADAAQTAAETTAAADATSKANAAQAAAEATAAADATNKANAAEAAATAVANTAQAAADTAQATADSAATAAADAQADADTANSLLADIVSDGNLSPQEKRETLKEWLIIAGEKSTIDTQSATYGVSVSAYDAAFTALATYLNGGSTWTTGTPSMLSDLESVIGIDGAMFRGKFTDYYNARTAILNAFTDKAKADAATAQGAADTAATAAATAQAKADTSVQQDTLYNGIKINVTDGFKAQRSDNKVRSLFNATGGILIQRSDDGGSTWVDQFEVDTDGYIVATGMKIVDGTITITHANGSQTVIDGTALKIYPAASDTDTYISVDSKGLKRVYDGATTYFRDAIATGNRTITGTHEVYSYTSGTMDASFIDATDTIDLLGGEWVGKTIDDIQASFAIVGYGDTPEDDPDRNYVLFKRQPEVTGVTSITGGIRVAIVGGVTWMYDIDDNGAGPCTDVPADYTYLIFG
jgi:phage minor structural protein